MADLRLQRIEDGDREALEHIARALEGAAPPATTATPVANGKATPHASPVSEPDPAQSLHLAPSGIDALLEAMPAAIGILKDEAIITVNSAFAYAFGYRSPVDLMSAGGLSAVLPGGMAALAQPGPSGRISDVEALTRSRRRLSVAFALTTLDASANLRLLRLLDQRDLDEAHAELPAPAHSIEAPVQDIEAPASEVKAPVSILTATPVPPVTPVPDPVADANEDPLALDEREPAARAEPAPAAEAIPYPAPVAEAAPPAQLNEEAAARQLDFLAKVSHEVRTPLNSIIGFAELMVHERFGPMANARYKGYAEDIHQSGLYALSLLNDLLDISKIEAGKFELDFTAVDAAEVVEACVASLQPLAKRMRIVLRSSFAEDLPQVIADPRRLRQIMLNLLTNAIKFTREGGQVIVSGTIVDGELRLRVHDSGVGMSKGDIAYAMEPFNQLDTSPRHQTGTGLGLPLTKALTDAIRARLKLTSEPGVGTSADVIFPKDRLCRT